MVIQLHYLDKPRYLLTSVTKKHICRGGFRVTQVSHDD